MIPKIIHQTWKTKDVPKKWLSYVNKIQKLNPDWKYVLWTDDDNDAFVKKEFPGFYKIFNGFSRGIMRADVIRYLIMYKIVIKHSYCLGDQFKCAIFVVNKA